MPNSLKIKIKSDIQLTDTEELYLYLIGEEESGKNDYYYSYYLNNGVATKGEANTVYAIPLSSLTPDSTDASISYFNFDQSSSFSGRIWFSTSDTLLTISNLQVNQPNPWDGLFFDFVELTITPDTNVNCDTTQVVGLGIPITMIDPKKVSFPSETSTTGSGTYTYPDAVGIVPGLTLQQILTGFKAHVKEVGLKTFDSCVAVYGPSSAPVNWLINPGYLVQNYSSGVTPDGLATALDDSIYNFFNYYYNQGNTLQLVFKGIAYTGSVVQQNLDPGNSTQPYTALVFTDPSGNTYPVYYPYFNTNSASSQGGTLNPGGVLPPPPSFWSSNGLNTAMPASGQVFLCEGAFNDSNPNVSDISILAALQNIVVTLLNRGLIPGTQTNLISCTGALTLASSPVSFTDPGPVLTASGATMLYTPSQIPAKTALNTCSLSGTIQLQTGAKEFQQQTFSVRNGVATVSPVSGSTNYCTQISLQYDSNQNVQFVFQYVNAVWPYNNTVPDFDGSVTGSYVPIVTSAATAGFATQDSISSVTSGMNVFDINVQNPSNVVSTDTNEVTIQSTINGLLPSPGQDTLIFGNFYPTDSTTGKALFGWNAYAAYLHYGTTGMQTPYISNQGYAFAYDDDGGYSSDITITFPSQGDCELGIYLGPLN